MPVVRTDYQTGETLPALLQRDTGGTLYFRLESGGVSVPPTTATVALVNRAGTQITTGTVSIGTEYAQSAVSPSALADQSYAVDYWATWTLDGRAYRQRVGVVRFAPACPVSQTSLIRGRPMLLRALAGTGQTTLDDWIERGWDELQRWLWRRSTSRAHLVMDASELYDLAEAYALRAFWQEVISLADPTGHFYRQFELARERQAALERETSLTYDYDDDGYPDDGLRDADGPLYTGAHTAQRLS